MKSLTQDAPKSIYHLLLVSRLSWNSVKVLSSFASSVSILVSISSSNRLTEDDD